MKIKRLRLAQPQQIFDQWVSDSVDCERFQVKFRRDLGLVEIVNPNDESADGVEYVFPIQIRSLRAASRLPLGESVEKAPADGPMQDYQPKKRK